MSYYLSQFRFRRSPPKLLVKAKGKGTVDCISPLAQKERSQDLSSSKTLRPLLGNHVRNLCSPDIMSHPEIPEIRAFNVICLGNNDLFFCFKDESSNR